MAEFKLIDEATFEATRRSSGKPFPRAVSAMLDRRRRRVVVRLDTGIEFAFDPARIKGLGAASIDELAGVMVEGAGGTLHFPRIDVDLVVARLLEEFLGPMDWTRREARADASRKNGRLGGRPKRLIKVAAS